MYGIGKFNNPLDEYVYKVTLQGGCDDEIGSVTENGYWYGLMRDGRSIFLDNDPFLESLSEGDRELLTSCAGVIVSEDADGFVYVEYYHDEDELNDAWQRIVEFVSAWYDEDGEKEE